MSLRTSGTPTRLIPESQRSGEMTSRLPSKLFFRIGEVASLVGVEPHVLRYWEREFRSIRPTKSAKGQRVYSRKDVENLLRVRDLLYRDGFTIAGAKKRMQRGASDATDTARSSALSAETEGADEREEDEGDRELVATTFGHGQGDDRTHHREGEVVLTQPESGPRAHASERDRDRDRDRETGAGQSKAIRRKLTALRAEVESFLVDLESA